MNEEQVKRPYGAPRLAVAEFRTERGFALSGGGTNNTENRIDGGIITNGADDGWF